MNLKDLFRVSIVAGLLVWAVTSLAQTLDAKGIDETSVRANGWTFEQVLATAVHGIILAHADTPGAVRAFVEAVRLPNREQGVGPGGVPDGRRGVHGIATGAKIWGISTDEYLQKADPWPLNPKGELMLSVKIEDRYAFANLEETLKVPGLSFGESGPSDMALSMGIKTSDPRMKEVLAKILAVAKLHNLAWEGINKNDVVDKIKEGYRIGFGLEAAEIGRKYTNRTKSHYTLLATPRKQYKGLLSSPEKDMLSPSLEKRGT